MAEPNSSNNIPTGSGDFLGTPTAQGGESKPIRPEDILKIQLYDEAVTSSFTISRLFSLKKRRFIKPCEVPKFWLTYCLLPGNYIHVYSRHHKSEELMTWYISIVRVFRNENGEVQMEKIKEVKWITPVYQSERTVPILRDVGNPTFHWHSEVDYTQQYTQQEVDQLLQGGVDPGVGEDIQDS